MEKMRFPFHHPILHLKTSVFDTNRIMYQNEFYPESYKNSINKLCRSRKSARTASSKRAASGIFNNAVAAK